MRSSPFRFAFIACTLGVSVWGYETWPQDVPRPCAPENWKKEGVVLRPELPAEGSAIQVFNAPAEPLGGGRWRLWYGVNDAPNGVAMNIGYADGVPGGKMERHLAVLSEGEPANAPLSIGGLPDGWRPVQPTHIKLRNGKDRLYFWVHAEQDLNGERDCGVIRLLAAESDDGHRYRMVNTHSPCLYHPADRAVEFHGTTASGLTLPRENNGGHRRFPRPADELPADPNLISNDSVSIYQLTDGSFELYVAALVTIPRTDPRWVTQLHDNVHGGIRVIDRMVSEDGLRWHGRQRVIEPDAQDPIDQQFYYLDVIHTPEGRVGLLGHYRLYAQTMDIEWCYSRDGLHWVRPSREAWLRRSASYAGPDSYGLYPCAAAVEDAGKWWLFYTGVNYSHNHQVSFGKPASVILLASTPSLWATPNWAGASSYPLRAGAPFAVDDDPHSPKLLRSTGP